MPFSTIDSPKKYFDTSLYTGTGSSLSVSNLNFQPDLVWLKGRSGATDHALYDNVRGVQKDLVSNSTAAETTQTTGLTAFNSTGFTIGTLAKLNTSTATYCSWNWLGANTTASNTNGSITSTVSANTTSGFSIVSYTGNGTNGATVGHGLGVAPKMFIIRERGGVNDWVVYNASLDVTAQYTLRLNTTGASTNANATNNNTAPTSSLITLGTSSLTNGSSKTYIAYCFAEVKGFSKAFSYTGNGSTDGTFVYCGFRPAYVLIKYTSGIGQDWYIWDNKRVTYNPNNNIQTTNTSQADTITSVVDLDILSNGFKCRNTNGGYNASGGNYIGIAFAENPFCSSKGIPTTAR